jgi:hypothetical protein
MSKTRQPKPCPEKEIRALIEELDDMNVEIHHKSEHAIHLGSMIAADLRKVVDSKEKTGWRQACTRAANSYENDYLDECLNVMAFAVIFCGKVMERLRILAE